MVSQCDVVTIVRPPTLFFRRCAEHQNAPLHEGTKGLFNKELISKMKKGAWLVNTARGAICIRQDVADAVASGHLNGYAGDVWGTSLSLTSRQVMTDDQMFSLLPRITLGEQ